MHLGLALLCLTAVAFAAPVIDEPGYDVDNEALLVFALISAQNQGIGATKAMEIILPSLLNNDLNFSQQQQLALLNSGGLSNVQATKLLTELMPLLLIDGKSTQEQTMALLLATKQFCRKNKDDRSLCPDDEETVLPLVLMKTERGCNGSKIVTDTEVAQDEKCICGDQNNMQFWISLFSQFSNSNDHLPILMMMDIKSAQCNGLMKTSGAFCQCSGINLGNEATMLQFLYSTPQVKELLTPEQQEALKEAATPKARASIDELLYASIAGTTSPQYLSLLQNQGEDREVVLENLILSSFGLDSSLVQVILNGGFGDDAEKVGLIRYLTNIGSIQTDVLPLLTGVTNGEDFYLRNLVGSGKINPLVAMIYLANKQGASQEELLQYFSEAISGGPEYFTSIVKPYIPSLPKGIYPGSKLFFAHFELLGINTCSLHDLRNRVECGYIGISAGECETAPYCCYNPIFMTDTEVRESTEGTITTASAIPWCYYNVFFIYYDSYFMEVKSPGRFASPIQCLPLYKYGLRFDTTFYHLFDNTNPTDGVGRFINPRTECGFPGITEFQCVAIRGCCWDPKPPYRETQCYHGNGTISFDYDIRNLPKAYLPTPGACDANRYKIPLLYYNRTACKYSFEHYVAGYNPLADPTPLDCLTKLGCCWENDPYVLKNYPQQPRCYKRFYSELIQHPITLDISTLIQRSGDGGNQFGEQFPPITKPDP